MAFSNFIPEIWSARLLEHMDKVHVYANLMNRDYEGDIKAYGDTVHINLLGDITISNYTGSALGTPQELDSTKQTLEIGERERTDTHLFTFSDHMIDHLVHLAHQVVSMKAFQHPIFRTLQKYDATYNTEYFPTLLHYLKSGGNMSTCAKELDIHYNTMKYRLKNIKQITHSDVSAPNVFTALYLSMHAMQYHTKPLFEA